MFVEGRAAGGLTAVGRWDGWQSRRLLGEAGDPWPVGDLQGGGVDLALILRRMEGEGAWGQSRLSLAEGCGEGQLGGLWPPQCGEHVKT